ncbi:MAG: hypothetical protein LBF36_01080 [Mycoplasmataceae bacterium]|nr:hypothetical protein [Mycoplasmataceae bacterium]
MELNKVRNSDSFYVFSAFWSGGLSFLGLIISIVVGLVVHRFDVLFSFVINLPFPIFVVWVSSKTINWIFSYIKNGGQKKQIILFSMLLFILKYIIVVTPLIIGLIINQVVNTTIFDPLTLVVGALIYPTTTLIVQWYFIRKENTKTA